MECKKKQNWLGFGGRWAWPLPLQNTCHGGTIIYLIVIIGFSAYKVNAQKINNFSCDTNVKVGFIYPPVNSEEYQLRYDDTTKPLVTIYFEDTFEDTLSVYFNDKLMQDDYFKSQFSTGYTGKKVVLDYSDSPKKMILKIVEKHNKFCLETKILKGYRRIELYHINGKWLLDYSNYGQVFK